MHPLHLNLLPPAKKLKLKSLVIFLFIKENMELLLITAATLSVAYLASWLVLTEVVEDLATSTNLVNREFSTQNQRIRQVNNRIRLVLTASAGYLPLAPQVTDLIKSFPPDLKATAINFNREDGSLLITGVAATREALLAYQTSLAAFPWLAGVTIPSSELLNKRDTNFSIRAIVPKLKPIASTPATDSSRN